MKDLIRALEIFLKYGDAQWPTHCEHDVLYVDIRPEVVSEEDKILLKELSFVVDEEIDCFRSYRFGSC